MAVWLIYPTEAARFFNCKPGDFINVDLPGMDDIEALRAALDEDRALVGDILFLRRPAGRQAEVKRRLPVLLTRAGIARIDTPQLDYVEFGEDAG